jgi:hypothetical protein
MDFTFTNLSATTVDTYWMVPYRTIEAEEMESEMDFTFTNLSATTVDTYWMVPYRTIEAEEMDGKINVNVRIQNQKTRLLFGLIATYNRI